MLRTISEPARENKRNKKRTPKFKLFCMHGRVHDVHAGMVVGHAWEEKKITVGLDY